MRRPTVLFSIVSWRFFSANELTAINVHTYVQRVIIGEWRKTHEKDENSIKKREIRNVSTLERNKTLVVICVKL